MVDYICIPYSQLSDHLDFNVVTVSDIASNYNIPLPNKLSQMPDHSVIMTETAIGEYVPVQEYHSDINIRYDLKNIPQDFMNLNKADIRTSIKRIENDIKIQKDINSAYNDLVSVIKEEMEHSLKKVKSQSSHQSKGNNKLKKKPWWCE